MPSKKTSEPAITALDAYELTNNWDGLEELVAALARKKPATKSIDALLRVFERYPANTDEELMAIVHCLEKTPGYESRLVSSMNRVPSAFGARMINRLLNSGVKKVGNASLIKLLEATASHKDTSPGARDEILGVLEQHGVQSKAKTESKKFGKSPSLPGMESFVVFLLCKADDAALAAFVKSLGQKFAIENDGGTGYLCMRGIGVEFIFSRDKKKGEKFFRLTTIAFNAEGVGKYSQFQGKLSHDLDFDFNRTKVRTLLGAPELSGGGLPFGKTISDEWDRWTLNGVSVMVKYRQENGKVGSIQVRPPREAAGK